MGRGFKIFGGILAVVVVAVVGFVVLVYSNLDSIVKDAVEEYGPQFTGVSVTLDNVELSPETARANFPASWWAIRRVIRRLKRLNSAVFR